MLVGSFLSGLIPMSMRLSDSKSRLLALMGSGILVGTALAIIIPEGIDSIYLPNESSLSTASESSREHSTSHENTYKSQIHDQIMLSDHSSKAQALLIGLSLVAGFVLMLLIDQFSIYHSGVNHKTSSTSVSYASQHKRTYSLANQDDGAEADDDEDDEVEQYNRRTLIGASSPISDESTSDVGAPVESGDASLRVSMRGLVDHQTSLRDASRTNYLEDGCSIKSKYNRMHSEETGTKVTPTLGLVIHASADGIALGAAATSSHREVEMIIFLAIMLHKAPAAFSLVVFLLHRGLRHATIRRHLMAFSLSAPLAALVTYFGLSQSGKEALRQNNATGIAMLFSAGTFLYVATVHVLPELVHNKLLTLRELLFLVGGAFLPILLAQSV